MILSMFLLILVEVEWKVFLKQLFPSSFFNSYFRYCLQYLPFINFIQLMEQPVKMQLVCKPKLTQKLQTPIIDHLPLHSQLTPKCIPHQCFPQQTQKNVSSLQPSQQLEDSEVDQQRNGVNGSLSKSQKKNNKMKLKSGQKQQQKQIQDQQKSKQATNQSSQANLIPDNQLLKGQVQEVSPKKQIKRKSVTPRNKRSRSIYKFDKNDEESYAETYQFPFANHYIEKHSEQFLSTAQAIEKAKTELRDQKAPGTFLNCDVRYFNWELFIQEVGKFDVLVIDPPWRIKGAQQNDSQFMFSNCKFSLEYNTMGNSEIARIPLNLISDEGFIFLWILNSQLDTSIQIMQTWGYELIDQITWVKLRDGKIYLTHGYYFMHSYEVCLVGYKNNKQAKSKNPEERLKMRGSLTNNTMFAEVRKKSQKPQDLYAIIELMFPGKRSIEIFARNHNLRFGLFSIGNELGQSYEKWNLHLNCDKCSHLIEFGTKRYKSKLTPNYDLCYICIEQQNKLEFFQISNEVDQDIRHEYVACNHCGIEPIWGIRFQCHTCHDFDICQNCYDKNLSIEEKFHPIDHEYRLLEIPVFGNGFPIHEVKCFSCYQNPIIGVYFNCTYCKNYKLCQKCYFQRPKTDSTSRNHKPDHHMQVIFEPQVNNEKKYQCFACKVQIIENCHMCENCYNFFFCENCFEKKQTFKSLYANNHKKYHVYTKIF